MRKTLFYALACIAMWSCKKVDRFELIASFNNRDTGKIYLELLENRNYTPIDSTEIVNGTATFSGKLTHPEVYFLTIDGVSKRTPIFIEPGSTKISVEIDSPTNAPLVKGPGNHNLYNHFVEKITGFIKSSDSLNAEYLKLKNTSDTAAANHILKQLENIEYQQNQFSKTFIKTHNNIVGLYIIRRFLVYNTEYDELKTLLEGFNKNLHPSTIYRDLAQQLLVLEKTMIGKPAPEFSMENPEGKIISLKDYRGKYLLIDFWASWCSPCRQANPHLVELYNQYRNENLAVLGVSLDHNREKWLEAIGSDGLTWDHVSDLRGWKNRVAQLYGVNSIPRMFLIDPNGMIIANRLTHEELTKKLSEIFSR